MVYATGAHHMLAYVEEAEFGTTPASPSLTLLRATRVSLALSKEVLESEEIRPDRQVAALRHGQHRVGGEIGFELGFGSFDAILAAALFGDWQSNELRAGTLQRSFTIERAFEDIARYAVFSGCCFDGLSLSIQPNAIVTGRLAVLGSAMAEIASQPLDAAPAVASTYAPFDSFLGSIEESGQEIGIVTGLEINLENGLDPAYVIGAAEAPALLAGKSRLSGTLTAYFEDETLIAKFIDETPSSICLDLVGDGGAYEILMGNVKYTGGALSLDRDGPILLTMPFTALFDPAEGSQIRIRRTAA